MPGEFLLDTIAAEGMVDRPDPQAQTKESKPEVNPHERNRLIAHLGRTFARRYDMQVLPSRQKGLWATALDPKTSKEMGRYIDGERDTLDDLPAEAFVPTQILYDEKGAMEMSMDEIMTILHHEAGHAKYTDFRLMIEGQRKAKDEGNLPTSFWLTFEGIEDPRVNSLEGEESPAIDRQIRRNQAKDLQERITETPLTQRPLMLQFAYNSFHYWLHGEGIPELAGTDVGRLGELARPLLQQYFENTDVGERKLLQQQIWDIAKELEKKDIEQEEKRQMAQDKQKGKQQPGEGQPGEQGQPGGSTGDSGEQQASSGQGEGEGAGQPSIPGGESSGGEQQTQASDKSSESGRRRIRDRLKDRFFGSRDNESATNEDTDQQSAGEQNEEESKQASPEPKPEKFDLSQLTPEELKEIEDAIEQLTPEDRADLTKKAREAVDEEQKEALEEDFSKTMKLEKNKKTGEYEARPQTATEKQKRKSEEDYNEAVEQVEAEEREEAERQEAERRQQEEVRRQLDRERQEKIDMERAGFDPADRDKFLLYQSLEDSMYAHVRNFRQAIEKVIPRKKEPVYESGYFSGPKFDRRELVRRAPLGDEQFHMRQVEKPIGDPRLFIGLLVDNSVSMDKKKDQARKTVIFFSKVCEEMGIPFMAGAFGDHAEVIKEFNQDFGNPSEKVKPKIIDATDARGGGTNLHAGLEVTIEAMREQRRRVPDSHGLIFVITDGEANLGLTGEDLTEYVEQNRGRLTFNAFGLSGNSAEKARIQTHLNGYFGESNCAYPEGFDDLPDEAFRMLRVKLMQFQRFMS